jgi:hypothetical protein
LDRDVVLALLCEIALSADDVVEEAFDSNDVFRDKAGWEVADTDLRDPVGDLVGEFEVAAGACGQWAHQSRRHAL